MAGSDTLVDNLKRIVGDGGWTTSETELEPHLREWRDTWTGKTLIMVSPATTEDGIAPAVKRSSSKLTTRGEV